MATQPYQPTYGLPEASVHTARGGPAADAFLAGGTQAYKISTSDGSEHLVPRTVTEIRLQNRLCGDFYCELGGKRSVSAIGATRDEAFVNALAKVSA